MAERLTAEELASLRTAYVLQNNDYESPRLPIGTWEKLLTAAELLQEIRDGAALTFTDPRLDYVEVQIPKETWEKLNG